MSLSLNDLKKGVIFRFGGQLYISLGGRQKVSGRQRSVVAVRARQLPGNQIVDHVFRGNEAVELVATAKKTSSFLYRDNQHCYFMDPKTYNQHYLDNETVGDRSGYLAEGQKVILVFVDGQPITLELPKNVNLTVVKAEPAVRGDTATTVLKNVKLDTGLAIKTPSFIKAGDRISIDTETGSYRERAK